MPKFGKKSKAALATCHPLLQLVFHKVIREVDCSVLEGHRGEYTQNKYFEKGTSKLKFPNGKHNSIPSKAVDVVPYPIDWEDIERMRMFAGYVQGVAAVLGVKIRCGADWDGDWDLNEQTFIDLPHFELAD